MMPLRLLLLRGTCQQQIEPQLLLSSPRLLSSPHPWELPIEDAVKK